MLVGRDAERSVVDAVVSGARIGRSGVLLVTGVAGIGKTALLDYAVERAHDVTVRRATGTAAEQDLPFAGLLQLLRPSQADLDALPAPQARALGVALALREGEPVDRLAVGAATLSLLVRASEDGPLGLFVDDAHLLDPPSAEALTFAARRLLADPVCLVAAARVETSSVLTLSGLPELLLSGLDAAAAEQLVRTRSDAPVAEQWHPRLHELTGGNPLALQLLAREPERWAAVGSPGSTGLDPLQPAPVPAAVADVYTQQAMALGAEAFAALQVVAVAGGDLPLVSRVCARRGVDVSSLAAAEREQMLRIRADRAEFVHPLLRAALYASAAPALRRELHAAVAAALPEPDLDRRAWHHCEAALGPDETVADELDQVGRRAGDRAAFAVAATAHERAARLSVDDQRRAERLLESAAAAWAAGDGARARATADRALELDGSATTRARGLGLQGVVAARTGSLAEARQVLLEAAAEVAPDRVDEALVLLAEAVLTCFYLGDAGTARAAAEQIEVLLGRRPGSDAAAVGELAAGMGRVLAGEPGMDRIRAALDAARRDGAGEGRALAPAWVLLAALWLRESGEDRRLARRVVADRRARAAIGGLPHLLFHVARDDATSDEWMQAEADYSETIALAREFAQTTVLAMGLAGLAWLEARLGRADPCRAHAAEALDIGAARQVRLAEAWARFALGDLHLACGEAAAAADALADLDGWLDRTGLLDVDLSPGPELAEALLRTGRGAEAEAVVATYAHRAQAKGQPWALARAERSRGLLCDDAEVDDRFRAAEQLHLQTPDVYERARTRLAHGTRLLRARRRVDARPLLQAALEAFEQLGARPWADRAADELAATGATARRRDTSDVDTLTPRELQVALLLADGQTTREAAAAIFVSPKTVEYHLRHVYTKLGIGSRAELAARFARADG